MVPPWPTVTRPPFQAVQKFRPRRAWPDNVPDSTMSHAVFFCIQGEREGIESGWVVDGKQPVFTLIFRQVCSSYGFRGYRWPASVHLSLAFTAPQGIPNALRPGQMNSKGPLRKA